MLDVIALLVADIHLSHKRPIARVDEDWYVAQSRPLRQLRELAEKHKAPILCAGDIFDKWNACPELINFAIRELPKMFAVPGQHDLPMHNYNDIEKSAYWTLVEAGRITELGISGLILQGILDVVGFPWGAKLQPRVKDENDCCIALIHQYVWATGCSYPGAPQEKHISSVSLRSKLKGYDVAVFGDNHQSFDVMMNDYVVFNCGCLIPRKSDERNHKPRVGLLHSDGSVTSHYLDTSEDKWIDVEEGTEEKTDIELQEFLSELKGLDVESLDFREALNRYLNDHKVKEDVKNVLLEELEGESK